MNPGENNINGNGGDKGQTRIIQAKSNTRGSTDNNGNFLFFYL